MTPSSTRI